MNYLNKRVTFDLANELSKYSGRIEFDWIYFSNGEYKCFDALIDGLGKNEIPAPTYNQVLNFLSDNHKFVNFTAIDLLSDENEWKTAANKLIRIHISNIK